MRPKRPLRATTVGAGEAAGPEADAEPEVVEVIEFGEDAAGEPEVLDIIEVVDSAGHAEVVGIEEIAGTSPASPATPPEPEAGQGAAPTN